jgi:1,4-alpha-glucan branching enzyme
MSNKKHDEEIVRFHQGNSCRAYTVLGAHRQQDGGAVFRVWAPRAKSVSVIGEFNGWTRGVNEMKRLGDTELWECEIENAGEYDSYKFSIECKSGDILDKADPFAFHAETRPANASKVYDIYGYEWNDGKWRAKMEAQGAPYNRPVSIYEMHLGSWKRVIDGPEGQFYSYGMIGDELIPYLKETGFTHVEFMPVTEHPLDASWGYQCTGYFAATSRHGTPKDLMRLIDRLHQAGIGVILDWTPAHFPKDAHGLCEFDGSYMYESDDPLMREHPDWGTRIFDYGKPEVRSFLISSAHFWHSLFHIDGIRMDAVASILYLDYGRGKGEWHPNRNGGRENLEAVEFLRTLNELIFADFPGTMIIAEESTSWPMVTKPTYAGGLGFNFKWNMGWMNDMMHYLALDPYFRQFNHKDITFSFMYAFSENYILPISHDEVVHGKKSLIGKMPGGYDEKFSGMRAFLAYMFMHPGKKLLFMGQEFAQFIEWNFENGLDWLLLEYERHSQMKLFVAQLNSFYRRRRELWEVDEEWKGFEWICHDDITANTICFKRRDKDGNELICAVNFSPELRKGYLIGVDTPGRYKELFNTDEIRYGGTGAVNDGVLYSVEAAQHKKPQSIRITLAPFGAAMIKLEKPLKANKKI